MKQSRLSRLTVLERVAILFGLAGVAHLSAFAIDHIPSSIYGVITGAIGAIIFCLSIVVFVCVCMTFYTDRAEAKEVIHE